MKLAEALILRADKQKRLEKLRDRLTQNAKVQEGDEPAENPEKLLEQYEETAAELEELIRRINKTNTQTELESGLSLTDALAKRDVLRKRHKTYRKLADNASVTHDRYSRSEVKFQSTVDVEAIQKKADDLARQHRELDTEIQETNWRADLIEE